MRKFCCALVFVALVAIKAMTSMKPNVILEIDISFPKLDVDKCPQ
jgi:hypothetical protein